ncbi:MAG: dihydrodipicolinate synthase family protein [Clostridiaceae bacterium]|nr:dihydrodipicolinate synthase family protein [Eubacteriales bacterium]
MKKDLRGLIPPIVTPFTREGDIDEVRIRKEMKRCIDAGVHGLSVSGSTGEGPTLRDEELRLLIGIAKEYVAETQPIVCGIMRACTRDAVRSCLVAKEAGADAVMVTPTAYNVLVPDEEGMFDFYSTISREARLPIIIYNVIPQNTIMPGLFRRLLDETEYVYGIKQSVGGIQALYAMIMARGEKGATFAATDDMLASCFSLGADGAISAVLSVFPKYCMDMWNLTQGGEYQKALAIQHKLYDAWQCISGNQFPIRVKYALSVMGCDTGYCRSPIVHLSDEEKRRIEHAFKNL